MNNIILIGGIALFLVNMSAMIISKFGNILGFVDVPNERSSHIIPTPRSGGIGIVLAFIIIGLFIFKNIIFIILAGLIGFIGLLEDRYNLSSRLRLFIQALLSFIIIFYSINTSNSFILFLFWIIFITGTLNFYNFMDGINGIASLTGIVAFALMGYFAYFISNEKEIAFMCMILSIACLGFLPFNFPKAKVFMGDVGSSFLGFVFASFVLILSKNLNIFLCLIMFLCTFYSDAIVTFFYRLKNKENLMQAHRKHLYQYMSNELALRHWLVAVIYVSIQLFFSILALFVYFKGIFWQMGLICFFGILFLYFYGFIKNKNLKSL
jgi:Fuc2NAc and GlcNAc transferase